MLTLQEIQALMPVIDVGIKAAGLQIFKNDGGASIQSALNKIQTMAEAAAKAEADAAANAAHTEGA